MAAAPWQPPRASEGWGRARALPLCGAPRPGQSAASFSAMPSGSAGPPSRCASGEAGPAPSKGLGVRPGPPRLLGAAGGERPGRRSLPRTRASWAAVEGSGGRGFLPALAAEPGCSPGGAGAVEAEVPAGGRAVAERLQPSDPAGPRAGGQRRCRAPDKLQLRILTRAELRSPWRTGVPACLPPGPWHTVLRWFVPLGNKKLNPILCFLCLVRGLQWSWDTTFCKNNIRADSTAGNTTSTW